MKRLHDEHVKRDFRRNTPIHLGQRPKQLRNQQFEGLEEYDCQIDAQQDGGPILRSHRETCRGIQHVRPRQTQLKPCGIQHLRLHQINGNITTIGGRTKVGILGDPLPELNSSDFFSSEMLFRLPESEFLGNRRGCKETYLPHATFSHVQSLHRSHSTDDMCAWLKIELRLQNRSSIHASCFTLRLTAH